MNDTMSNSQNAIPNYNGGFNRAGNFMNDQHGGPGSTASSDFPQQNASYNQFGGPNVRPGFPQSSRVNSRPEIASGTMMGPNFNSNQPRVISGPTIQQQGGPTPTLNQLLQNPGSGQRYQPGYGNYAGGQIKGSGDIAAPPNYGNPQGAQFANQQRPVNPYQQSIPGQGNPAYRPQQVYGGYPGSQQPGGQYGNQYGQMGGPHRYPMQQGRPYNQSNPPPPQQPQQQPTPSPTPVNNQIKQEPSAPSEPVTANDTSKGPQTPEVPKQNHVGENTERQGTDTPPQQNHLPKVQENSTSNEDPQSQSVENRPNQTPTPTSTPGPQHHPGSVNRPPPSPAGSTGSRSNTPASVTGNQAGSPMPPRPPSNQVEGQGRIHSPMQTHQGYNQQMPPPMGPMGGMAFSGSTPGKMGHPAMMGGQQMGGPYSSQYPNQQHGGPPFNRGMQPGYGNQQYPGAPGTQMYGNNMPGMHRPGMPNMGYPNQYGQQTMPGGPYSNSSNAAPMGAGINTSQSSMAGPHVNTTMSSSQPNNVSAPSNVPPTSMNGSLPPGQKVGQTAAQAAAHAAMMAAASQSHPSSVTQSQPSVAPSMNQPGLRAPAPGMMPQNRMYAPHPGAMNQGSGGYNMNQVNSGDGGSSTSPVTANTSSAPPTTNCVDNKAGTPGPEANSPMVNNLLKDKVPTPSTTPAPSDDEKKSGKLEISKPDLNKDSSSHPPTPVSTIPPSPSVSSVPEDLDNISSPSWPGTPGPVQKGPGGENVILNKLCDMGDEPERRGFLEKLFSFMEEKGTPITNVPAISKNAIDLYRLYVLVKEKGGLVEVTKQKKWRDIGGTINIGTSSSAGFTLKKNYCKFLFPYECRVDLGGVDPAPILAQIEAATQKKEKRSNSGMNQGMGPGGPMMPPNVSMMPNYGQDGNMMGNPPGNMMQSNGMMGPNNPMMNNMMPNSMGNNMMPNAQMGGNHMMQQQPGQHNRGMMGPMGGQSEGGYTMDPMNKPHYPGTSPINSQGMSYSSGQMGQPTQNATSNSYGYRGQYPPHSQPGAPNQQMYNQQGGDQTQSGPQGSQFRPQQNEMSQHNSVDGMSAQQPNQMHNQYGQYGNRFDPQSQQQQHQQPPQSTASGMPNTPMRSGPGIPTPQTSQASGPGYDPMYQGRFPNSQQQGQSAQQQQPMGAQPGGPSPAPPTSSTESGPPTTQSQQFGGFHSSGGSMIPHQQQGQVRPGFPQTPGQTPQQQPPQDQLQQPPQSQPQPGQYSNYSATSGTSQQPPYGKTPIPQPQSSMGTPAQQTPTAKPPYPGYQGQEQRFITPNYGQQQQGYGQNNSYYGSPNASMQQDMRRESWQQRSGSFSSSGGSANVPAHMGTPQGPGYMMNRMPSHRGISPQRGHEQKSFFSPATPKIQMSKQPVVSQYGTKQQQKESLTFPPGCVEATPAYMPKKKKVTYKDIGQVDPWRMMMSLKSGMLTETTWALNTLSVLLYDDHTVTYFGLKRMPGLQDVLLDHLIQTLDSIFPDEFQNFHLPNAPKEEESAVELNDGGDENEEEEEEDAIGRKFKLPVTSPSGKKLESSKKNFTLRSRKGLKVDYQDCSDEYERMFGTLNHKPKLKKNVDKCYLLTHYQHEDSLNVLRRRFFKRMKVADTDMNDNDECKNSDLENSCQPSSPVSKTEKNDDVANATESPSTPRGQTIPSGVASEDKGIECSDKHSTPIKQEPMDTTEDSTTCKSEPSSDTKNCSSCTSENDTKVEDKSENSTSPKSPKTEVKKETPVMEDSLNESKDIMIECNDMDKKFLERLKRKWAEGEEDDEAYQRDQPSLFLLNGAQEEISSRCICISNIFRSLSFLPGNDKEMSKHTGLMAVLGKLLLLHHKHPKREKSRHRFDREVDDDLDEVIHDGREEWWWDTLDGLHENTLVILANISGHLNLSVFSDEICMPILDGLLHWAICPSAYAQDPLPLLSNNSVLSPQRLVLESLCKLCVTDSNVDLILATPPFSRIVHLFVNLIKMLAQKEDQVLREFAIVLISSLVQGDSSAARAVALEDPSISILLDFIESAEKQAGQIANTHGHRGINMLKENPEMMGTTLDMLRRAANALLHLSMVPENRPLFLHQQDRLLELVMSHILDQSVAAILSDVLFHCSQES